MRPSQCKSPEVSRDAKQFKRALQITSRCTIATSDSTLSHYVHVLKQPHWYCEHQDILPLSGEFQPTFEQLEGIKLVQESLISYSTVGPAQENSSAASPRAAAAVAEKNPRFLFETPASSVSDRVQAAVDAVEDVCRRFVHSTTGLDGLQVPTATVLALHGAVRL
eukprot:Polyplicarium_translucidae@DN2340_c0_g1_i2.p1